MSTQGAFALVLHYADDEEHAWRIWDVLIPENMPHDLRGQTEAIKKAASATRISDRAPIV